MTKPDTSVENSTSRPAFVVGQMENLRKRADFLKAAKGKRLHKPGFVLQARHRHDTDALRVGFTCSKKVGNAVARNRAKRRLREIARLVIPAAGKRGYDYVLIGRAEATATLDFGQMCDDLRASLKVMHTP